MALVRFHDEDGYQPEFGTVVIRDAISATGRWQDLQSLALDEHAGPLFGTVARAGEGVASADRGRWAPPGAGGGPRSARRGAG
jgi:hypothetical protein